MNWPWMKREEADPSHENQRILAHYMELLQAFLSQPAVLAYFKKVFQDYQTASLVVEPDCLYGEKVTSKGKKNFFRLQLGTDCVGLEHTQYGGNFYYAFSYQKDEKGDATASYREYCVIHNDPQSRLIIEAKDEVWHFLKDDILLYRTEENREETYDVDVKTSTFVPREEDFYYEKVLEFASRDALLIQIRESQTGTKPRHADYSVSYDMDPNFSDIAGNEAGSVVRNYVDIEEDVARGYFEQFCQEREVPKTLQKSFSFSCSRIDKQEKE